MPVKSRRQTVSEETRQLLEKSATHLFATRKYEEVSVDNIAAATGLTKGAFYHHFNSKVDIFEACYSGQVIRIASHVKSTCNETDAATLAIARANTFLNYVLKNNDKLIRLDTAISVFTWARWKALDTNIFFPLISEPLELLHTQNQLSFASIPLLCDMLHAVLFNAIMSMAYSENPKQTMDLSMNIFTTFFQSLIDQPKTSSMS